MGRLLMLLMLLIVLGCGDSEKPDNSIPNYLGERPEKGDEIYYQLPDDIPIEMALVYKDYQELLTEEKFGLWLKSVKGFCDGDVTGASLSSRIHLWFPELHVIGIVAPGWRVPDYNRTREGREGAWYFWQRVRLGKKAIDIEAIAAPDHILSKANKDEHQAPKLWYDRNLRGKIYDCVEGYPKR